MKANKVIKKPLTISEKRVAVLKDAIAQIKRETYVLKESNGYVQEELTYNIKTLVEAAETLEPGSSKKLQLQKYLDRLLKEISTCEVCAKGALLLSSIRKFNHVTLQEVEECDLENMASKKMRKLFGKNNADRMENYFENDVIYGFSSTYEEDDKMQEFYDKYPNDNDRAIAIFKNAIRNKGIFRP
jgi:hypothetical protein